MASLLSSLYESFLSSLYESFLSKVIGEATVKGKSSLEIGASKLLWKMQRNDEGAEKYYNFRLS